MSLSQLLCIWRARRAEAARARRSRSLPRRNALRIEPLEPRLLLSADPLVIDPALDSTTEVSSGVLVEAVTATPQAVAGGPQEGPAAKKPGVVGAGGVAEEDPGDAPSTESAGAGALEDATVLAQAQLGLFAGDPEFVEKMALAFGDGADPADFRSAWSAGEFSILSGVDLRTAAELNGARGAYAESTDVIYLSREFVEANASAVERIAASLLEEAGHRLDGRLNASDSPGDEGEIFSALARGEILSGERLGALRAEDDRAMIVLDGEALLVERASAELRGGAGSIWLVSDDIRTSNGLPSGGSITGGGSGTGHSIRDASLPGSDNAFDHAAMVWVDDTRVGGALSQSGNRITFSPQTISGLTVQTQYVALPGSATLRTFVSLSNPSGSPVTVSVDYAGNFGSGVNTRVDASSSGDTVFAAADRWVITSDGFDGAPVNTTVLFGPDSPDVTPSRVSQTVFKGFQTDGTQGVLATYAVTIPAGQTRSLMFFQQLNETVAEAFGAATVFDAPQAGGGDLLAGLTQSQRLETVNWALALVADAGGPYVTDEGDRLTLDASGSTSAAGSVLRYRWDVDGDGDFDEDVTGVSPTLTRGQLRALGIDDGPATRTVTVQVTEVGQDGVVPEVEPNSTIATAQDVDGEGWNLSFNPDIAESTAVPHITVEGTGDGSFDYYAFTVANAGDRGLFDIDFGSGSGGSLDTELFLYDAAGTLLAANDDSGTATGGGGSTSSLDSFIDFMFPAPGTYVIGVGKFDSEGTTGGITGTAPQADETYTLQISLEGHARTAVASTTWTIANVAPSVMLDPVAMIDEGGVATLTGTITDPGTPDTFTLDIDWGDPLSPGNSETTDFGPGTDVDLNLIHSFEGPASPADSDFIPPDPTIAVGPDVLVAMVQTDIVIYDKDTGAEIAKTDLDNNTTDGGPANGGFWESTDAIVDPWVVFDPDSERFFALGVGQDPANGGSSRLYLAVSTGPTPMNLTSDWHTSYVIDRTGTHRDGVSGPTFPDDPKLGVDGDAVYITANEAGINGGGFSHVSLLAIEKAPLLAGGPVNILWDEVIDGSFSIQPMLVHEPAPAMYFAEVVGSAAIRLHALIDPLGTPSRVTSTVPVPAFLPPPDVPQQGGGAPLDAVGDRLLSGVVRDGSLWTAHAIQDPAVDAEAVVRWYEIDVSAFPGGSTAEVEPNDTIATAQNVDGEGWNLSFNSNVAEATTIPHITVEGTGDGSFDYYAFTVANAGDRGLFDIDFGFDGGGSLDTELFLYDAAGTLLASNDDSDTSTGGGGSTNGLDSFIDFTFLAAGIYVIGVGEFDSVGSPGGITGEAPDPGETYTLQISVEGHALSGNSVPLVQSGNVDPGPDLHTWVPHINVDADGDMAVAFSVGGPGQFASIGYTGRLDSDPAGTTRPVEIARQGEAHYQRPDGLGRNRWGDYSGLALDPDGETFWLFNEYAATGNTWATFVGTFQVELAGRQTFTLTHQYLDDSPNGTPQDTYTINATVTDDDGGKDADSALVTVQNVAPAVDAGSDQVVDEGALVSFSGAFTDPGTADTHTIEWNFGDGSTPVDVPATQAAALSPQHFYADDGVYTVTLTVTDDDSGSTSDTMTVAVANVAPAVVVGGPYAIAEGDALVLAGSASDPSPVDEAGLTFAWDLDADGQFDDAVGAAPTVDWNTLQGLGLDNDGIYTIALRVSDDETFTDATTTLTITNTAPTADAGGPYTISEGTDLVLAGAGSDPSAADDATLRFAWDLNDDAVFGDATGSGPTVPWTTLEALGLGDDGTFLLTLRVADDDTSTESSTTLIITNVAPTVALSGAANVDEGAVYTLTLGAVNDPGDDTVVEYVVDWGDGSVGRFGTAGDVTHRYADGDAARTIRVDLVDEDGIHEDTGALSLTVLNVPPDFDAGPDETLLPPAAGFFARPAVSFTDPGADVWSGTVSYGDLPGDQPLSIDQDNRTFDLSHTYTGSGLFTVQITLDDDDGGSKTDTFQVEVILNTPPVARDDEVTTDEDSPVLIDVLGDNGHGPDFDAEGNIVRGLTLAVADPAIGVLTNHGDGTFTYDPEGQFESLAAGQDATARFTYQIEDVFGETDTADVLITVTGVNDTPAVTLDQAVVDVAEGQTASNSGTFADIDSGDVVAIAASIGTVSQDAGANGAWSWSLSPEDGPADSQTVFITATDNHGGSTTTSFELNVTNVAPAVRTLAVDPMVDEQGTVTLSGMFEDPGTLDTHEVVIAWGDGDTTTVILHNGERAFSSSHQYLDDNPTGTSEDTYTINATVTDDDTGSATATVETLVRNVAPVITELTGTAPDIGDAAEGEPVTISGLFTDVGAQDTHTATIDWGDGTKETVTGDGLRVTSEGLLEGAFAGTHQYEAGGIYEIAVTLTDDDTGSATASTTAAITGVGIMDRTLVIVGTEEADAVDVRPEVLDPVAYWSLNETSGTTVADSAGTPQDGTFFAKRRGGPDLDDAGPPLVRAPFGAETGADFHGTTKEYIAVAHDAAFEVANGTVALWFKARDLRGEQTLFSKDHRGFEDGGHLNIGLDGNRLEVRLQSEDDSFLIRPDIRLHADTWYHLAVSFGDEGMQMYLNGTPVGHHAFTGGLTPNQEPIVIGGSLMWNHRDGANLEHLKIQEPFNGYIDEVAFFGEALSAEQIGELITKGIQMTGGSVGEAVVVEASFLAPPAFTRTVLTADFDKIVILLGDGDDHASVSTGIEMPVQMFGHQGEDVLQAGGGSALLVGGPGADHLIGGAADDELRGGRGDDLLEGGPGADLLLGDGGADVLVGGAANDDLRGGRGDDILIGGLGQDELDGGAGADLLIGDRYTPIVGWRAEGAGLTATGWKSRPDLHVGADVDHLLGGPGTDALVGDNLTIITGLAEGLFEVPDWAQGPVPSYLPSGHHSSGHHHGHRVELEIDGLLDDVRIDAAADLLDGGRGRDLVIGDNQTVVAGIVGMPPAAWALTGTNESTRLEVEIEELVDDLDIGGADDVLLGGRAGDVLIGDNDTLVAGLLGSLPWLSQRVGAGTGSALAPDRIDIEIEELIDDDLTVGAGKDILVGDGGRDELIGDNRTELAGFVGAGQLSAHRVDIEVEDLVDDDVWVAGADDLLLGQAGADRLTGDNSLAVAGVVGPMPSVTTEGRDARLALEIERLADDVWLGAGDDDLIGGRGADLLIGDNDLHVAGLAGDVTGVGRAHLEIERLLDDVTLAGGRDWLEGGPGDDRLIGDNRTRIVGVAGTLDWEVAAGSTSKHRWQAPVRIEIDKLVDDVTLAAEADWLDGGVGDDRLLGDHGTQVLAGIGTSPDRDRQVALTVRALVDDLYLKGGADKLHGGRGADVLLGDSQTKLSDRRLLDRLCIRGGNDHLEGGNGDDRLFGQQGCDTLRGGRGDDELVGGSGRDCLDGGPGDDSLNQRGTDNPHGVVVDLSVTAVRALDSRVFTPNVWAKRFVLDLAGTQDDFDPKQTLQVVLPNNNF